MQLSDPVSTHLSSTGAGLPRPSAATALCPFRLPGLRLLAARGPQPGLGLILGLLVGLSAASCGGEAAEAGSAAGGTAQDPERAAPGRTPAGAPQAPAALQGLDAAELRGTVRDLVVAVTPPAPTATAGFKNDWHERRRSTLERMRIAGPEVGRAVLEQFEASDEALAEVRIGLLDVAAHNLPDEVGPLLTELITTFGESLAVRTSACDLLARIQPAEALAVLGPVLQERKHRITYPPEEQMLRAWLRAARHEGVEQDTFLGDIAVQLDRDHATRQAAVRALAQCDGPVAIEALESLMVESSGNHLLRRTATQSLREVLDTEAFCARLREVLANESDAPFQIFLADAIEENCGR